VPARLGDGRPIGADTSCERETAKYALELWGETLRANALPKLYGVLIERLDE